MDNLITYSILSLLSLIGWTANHLGTIIFVVLIFYFLRRLEQKLLFYEDKILDIDHNIKQIADKIGIYSGEGKID